MNFREMRESTSLQIDRQKGRGAGVGGHDGVEGRPGGVDLFGAFSSITLHYDGEN